MLELVFAPVAPEAGSPVNWLAKSDDDIVYAALPGRNKYRPSQKTPIPNLTLCGCYTSQKFLGSMEGAVLAGKLAAEVVAARAFSAPTQDLKEVQRHVVDAAATAAPKKPPGCGGGNS